jgi:hypothetical protein
MPLEPRSVAESHRWINSGDRVLSLAGIVYLYGSVDAYPRQQVDPVTPAIRAQHFENRVIRSCPYRDHHCGCSLPTCHAGRGDHDDGKKASREHCLACLKATWAIG